jgi:phosphatidylserine decarboxylase
MDKLFIALQYILPHHLLSAVMHAITRISWAPFKNYVIRRVVDLYKVEMQDAVEPRPDQYASFNDFFTRALKADARPIAGNNAIACPVDGEVSQLGPISNGRIFQAKKHDYSLLELVGGDQALAAEFTDGQFATIYLSPRDYHRIHMPSSGTLRRMIHIPGRLFSVNRLTTREVPRLFARNERLVCIFDGENGPFAVILVGAIFVSSMETVWSGIVTPKRLQPAVTHYHQPAAVTLGKGEEMGRFNMGSTVVLLYPKDTVNWDDKLSSGSAVRMGEQIAALAGAAVEVEAEADFDYDVDMDTDAG